MKRILVVTLLVSTILFAGQPDNRQRIGVIGAGAGGMVSAWLLDQQHDVTVFERSNRLGGNAHSVHLEFPNHKESSFEVGFEFFDRDTSPLLTRLLKHLSVFVHEFELTSSFSNMKTGDSFTLTPIDNQGFAFDSIANLAYLLNLRSLLSDGADYLDELDKNPDSDVTVGEFLSREAMPTRHQYEFLTPFLLAGFGVTAQELMGWSTGSILKTLPTKQKGIWAPTWLEVRHGNQSYFDAIQRDLSHTQIVFNSDISDIRYEQGVYTVVSHGQEYQFDHLIIGAHADEAKKMLQHVNFDEMNIIRNALAGVKYHPTHVAIHGDLKLMPKSISDWKVVNIRSYPDTQRSAITVYKPWLSTKEIPVFKSFLTPEDPLPQPLYYHEYFKTLVMTPEFVRAQRTLAANQGSHHLWFVGAYLIGDRHEYAVQSAIQVAKQLSPQSERLKMLLAD